MPPPRSFKPIPANSWNQHILSTQFLTQILKYHCFLPFLSFLFNKPTRNVRIGRQIIDDKLYAFIIEKTLFIYKKKSTLCKLNQRSKFVDSVFKKYVIINID